MNYKIGKITLPVNTGDNPYIPHNAPDIVNNKDELELIALGARENLPVLLIGETGTGKTSFVRFLAKKTNNGFRRLNLNGGTTNDELVGHWILDENKTMKWIDGVLLDAMKNGYWIVLDELNACLPEITFILHSLLDDDRMLVLAEKNGEIVKPHANFRLFATMNPSLEYSGTRDLNRALLSRFAIVLHTKYQSAAVEKQIIKKYNPTIPADELKMIVKLANDIRKAKNNGTLSTICSTRDLIHCALLRKSLSLVDAVEISIVNKTELPADKKTITDIVQLLIGKIDDGSLIDYDIVDETIAKLNNEIKSLTQQVKNLTPQK